MSVNYVLDVKNLTVGYRNHVAVDDISFNVEKGDLLGIVGPNGAGKTTLFRAILGLQQYRTKIKLLLGNSCQMQFFVEHIQSWILTENILQIRIQTV